MNIKIRLVLLIGLLAAHTLSAQKPQSIKVQGTIMDMQGTPISGAIIRVEGDKERGATDDKGRFTMQIPENAQLSFSSMGFEPVTVKLKGRTRLEVMLKSSDTVLPEVTITSTLKKSIKFVFAPTDLELIKDQLFLKTRYRVPEKSFHKDSRLIIQPFLRNETMKTYKAFTPMVYDGTHYDILLKRGNICGDPKEKELYSPYAKVVDRLDQGDMIAYKDSCTVDDINHQYSTEVRIKISTFCQDEYRDTIIITHGVVYPMRFFNYNYTAKEMDDRYAPAQTAVHFDEKGDIQLRFRADDAAIYENEGRNASELRKLRNALGDIDKDASKTLNTFQITTYTSPEGSYEYNLKLAQKRTKNAAEQILKNISPEAIQKARVSHTGVIEPWTQICDRLVQDERTEEAKELEQLIKRARKDHNEISWGVRRLKCYSLIRDTYLPPLRRVEYFYEYSEWRTLNEKELDLLYQKTPENLTASEFWSYIRQQDSLSDDKKESLYRQALELHPNLMIAANNLSVLLIQQNRADTTLLKPFLVKDAPEEIWLNQTVALLQIRDFEKADRLAAQLPHNEGSRKVKALAAAMNGKYEEAYDVLAPQGGLNQVVLLLSMKRNAEAWEVLSKLEDHSAEAEYLRAITANRIDDAVGAFNYLKRAIELKPSLREIAEKDGDVLDLLENEPDKQ